MALVPGHDVYLVALDLAAEPHSGLRSTIPSRSREAITWTSSGSIPSS
jgi:hypothetical protein